MAEDRADREQSFSAFTGLGTDWSQLAEKLSELSRELHDKEDVEQTLQAIVDAAAGTVPGAEHASISAVLRRCEVHTTAATGELPCAVDQAQYRTGEGPCLDSLFESKTVRLDDVRTELRWPAFAARAGELGLRSMLAVQLHVTAQDLGALNLHSTAVEAFDDESEQVAQLFAAHAAVALADAREEEQLRDAISSRDLIGQAKGILMERYKISAEDAFRLLVVASQHTNIKLRDVADFLVSTGRLAAPEGAGS